MEVRRAVDQDQVEVVADLGQERRGMPALATPAPGLGRRHVEPRQVPRARGRSRPRRSRSAGSAPRGSASGRVVEERGDALGRVDAARGLRAPEPLGQAAPGGRCRAAGPAGPALASVPARWWQVLGLADPALLVQQAIVIPMRRPSVGRRSTVERACYDLSAGRAFHRETRGGCDTTDGAGGRPRSGRMGSELARCSRIHREWLHERRRSGRHLWSADYSAG